MVFLGNDNETCIAVFGRVGLVFHDCLFFYTGKHKWNRCQGKLRLGNAMV